MNIEQFKETTMRIIFFIIVLMCNLNSLAQDVSPVVFAPDVISSKESSEYGMTFINDSFILFTRQTHIPEIYSSRKTNKSWTDLQKVSFNSRYGDEYPHYSKKLNRVYYC